MCHMFVTIRHNFYCSTSPSCCTCSSPAQNLTDVQRSVLTSALPWPAQLSNSDRWRRSLQILLANIFQFEKHAWISLLFAKVVANGFFMLWFKHYLKLWPYIDVNPVLLEPAFIFASRNIYVLIGSSDKKAFGCCYHIKIVWAERVLPWECSWLWEDRRHRIALQWGLRTQRGRWRSAQSGLPASSGPEGRPVASSPAESGSSWRSPPPPPWEWLASVAI